MSDELSIVNGHWSIVTGSRIRDNWQPGKPSKLSKPGTLNKPNKLNEPSKLSKPSKFNKPATGSRAHTYDI